MTIKDTFSQALAILKGQDKDTIIFGIIVVCAFTALVLKAPPLPTILLACLLALIYPITQYLLMRVQNERQRLALQVTLQGGSHDLINRHANDAERQRLDDFSKEEPLRS